MWLCMSRDPRTKTRPALQCWPKGTAGTGDRPHRRWSGSRAVRASSVDDSHSPPSRPNRSPVKRFSNQLTISQQQSSVKTDPDHVSFFAPASWWCLHGCPKVIHLHHTRSHDLWEQSVDDISPIWSNLKDQTRSVSPAPSQSEKLRLALNENKRYRHRAKP